MQLSFRRERWPLARAFKISRGAMQVAYQVFVELRQGIHRGRGECEMHESDEALIERGMQLLEQLRPVIENDGLSRAALLELLAPGPTRNALDCALWDLEAKRSGIPAWRLAQLDEPRALTTVYTISADDPATMAQQACAVRHCPILKVKLKGAGDVERVQAVRRAAPDARLIVDANEAWSFAQLQEFAPRLQPLGVELIEQPLPRGQDAQLLEFRSPVPLCADESCHDTRSLPDVVRKYQYINIKLDKSGGLTEALRLDAQARRLGLRIMVGCMVGTSLAMAPAMLIARNAEFVDLDGPLLLAQDRQPGLLFDGTRISPPTADVWG
jgi:L-alanine-DL-glutamate epimerase-like enolase superfamily enzyme